MNKWIAKSIKLANSKGYLDKLFAVYPIELGTDREISEEIKIKVRKAFKDKNRIDLIRALLELPRFPVDDPYIASLRKYPHLLEKNPQTLKRISGKMLSMSATKILKLASKSKSPSRQFGHTFKKWLLKIKYPFLEEEKFKIYKGVAFLRGSDKQLKQFAVRELKLKRLSRRPDFILKIKNKFILGEAKFLTDYGGTQNNQLDGALKITWIKDDNIIGVAVLDGIVWFQNNSYMHKAIKKSKGVVLSALLLKQFIRRF